MSWISRFVNVFRSSEVDRALEDEIGFHIESRVEELVAAGVSRAAAEATAKRQFGNQLRVRELSRDVKIVPYRYAAAHANSKFRWLHAPGNQRYLQFEVAGFRQPRCALAVSEACGQPGRPDSVSVPFEQSRQAADFLASPDVEVQG